MNGYELREYRPGDEHAILAAFRHVFQDGRAAGRSLAEWRWEFLQNPGGWRIWLALQGRRVIAQSAGLAHRTRVHGRDASFSQTVDSMVLPEHARSLKNPGLFVRTVLEYVRAYAGSRDLVFYGWPNRAARRIGRARLGYEVVRREVFLVRAPSAGRRECPADVAWLDGFGAAVDRLWQRCARAWPVAIVHDAAFLRWRFCNRPGRRYEALAVRDGEELLGLCVLRAGGGPQAGTTSLVEWLVPDDRPEVGEALLAAAGAHARACTAPTLVALFPPWSPWWRRLRAAGFDEQPSDLHLTVRINGPEIDRNTLQDGWWMQLGDSDLV